MALPPNAKRVFKGVIFDVYQWKQKMFDGSFKTFEMLKRPNSILVIPTMDGKILLANEEQPHKGRFLELFGGRHEEGEEPLDGAKRELLEESGLTSEDWELWKTHEPNSKIDSHIFVFLARDCSKTADPHLDPGERIETLALTFPEFLEMAKNDAFTDKEVRLDLYRMLCEPNLAEGFRRKMFPRQK